LWRKGIAIMRAVDLVVELFPERTESVRRLYLQDEHFRAICDDFALSVTSLRHFEARPDAHSRPEVADYHAVLRELTEELRRYIGASDTQ